jgi:hypothetical protein
MIDRSIHPNSRVLLDAWRRMNVDPGRHAAGGPDAKDHPGLIARLFVLESLPEGGWTFGSAGDGISALLGRSVEGMEFLELWSGPDRAMMAAFLEAVRLDGSPGVMRGRGETLTGQRVEIELTFAPLTKTSAKARAPRMLGLYQTLGGEAMLKGRPVWRHRISMLVPPDSRANAPALNLVSSRS